VKRPQEKARQVGGFRQPGRGREAEKTETCYFRRRMLWLPSSRSFRDSTDVGPFMGWDRHRKGVAEKKQGGGVGSEEKFENSLPLETKATKGGKASGQIQKIPKTESVAMGEFFSLECTTRKERPGFQGRNTKGKKNRKGRTMTSAN